MDRSPQASDHETGTHSGRHHTTTQTLRTNADLKCYQNDVGTVKNMSLYSSSSLQRERVCAGEVTHMGLRHQPQ